MSDLIFRAFSWPTFSIALLVFGFAPGVLLRVIALAFPRDDPRRRELLGELYGVPRIQRPFWVAEQLERALVEGLGQRLVQATRHRAMCRWHLVSVGWPRLDYLLLERQRVVPGTEVLLMFGTTDGWRERMCVIVTAVKRRKLIGELSSVPYGIPRLMSGAKIKFRSEHIILIFDDSLPMAA